MLYKQRKTDEAKQKIVRGQNFKGVFSHFLHNKQATYALGGGPDLTVGATDNLAWICVRKGKLFLQ